MKPAYILSILILLVLMLATTLVITAFNQPIEPTAGLNSALQSKISFPQIDTDLSEVGSTSGIFIMGVVITLIISAPLIYRKKKH